MEQGTNNFLQIKIPHSSKVSLIADILKDISRGREPSFDRSIKGLSISFKLKLLKFSLFIPNK